jgi:hypothetical protein
MAGDGERAVEYASPIASGALDADEAQIAAAVQMAANALRLGGRMDEGWALLEPYVDAERVAQLPLTEAAQVARQIGIYLHGMRRADEAMFWVRRGLSYAEELGDPRLITLSLSVIGIQDAVQGHTELGNVVLELAADVARRNQLVTELAQTRSALASFATNTDPAAAVTAGEEAYALWEQGGAGGRAWNSVVNLAAVLTSLGRWDEIAALVDRPLLQEFAPPAPEEALINFQLARLAIARGSELDRSTLERLAGMLQLGQLESLDDMCFVACKAALARNAGDKAEIVRVCKELVRTAFEHISLEDDFPMLWNEAVQWTIEAGDLGAARELLRYVADAPATRLNPMLAAELPRLRGTIEAVDAEATADPESVERDLLDAIAKLGELGLAPDRARAQAALGRWLIRRGRHADAQPHLAAARQTFSELRATAWLQDLDAVPRLSVAG